MFDMENVDLQRRDKSKESDSSNDKNIDDIKKVESIEKKITSNPISSNDTLGKSNKKYSYNNESRETRNRENKNEKDIRKWSLRESKQK